MPVLVARSHGTADARGRAVAGSIAAQVVAARPDVAMRRASVDVQEPPVADVVRSITDFGRPAVVVPLLLSTGIHVRVDNSAAVEGRSASGSSTGSIGRSRSATPLGRPHG